MPKLPTNNPKKQFNSKEFNELKNDWNKKLKETGFEDAECTLKNGHTLLKQWHSSYFKSPSHGFKDPELYALKADYFYYATQFLHTESFAYHWEREIWALHTEGWGVREIAKKLQEKGITGSFSRNSIWKILGELKAQMSEFLKKQRGEKVNKEDILQIRPIKPEDEAFVYSTWLQNLYANTRWRTQPTRKAFFKYHDVIEHILRKAGTSVNICCLKDDPDVIVGYCVFEKNPVDVILHWIFVRADWQRQGIAYDLAPPHITVVTHMTKIGERIWQKLATKPKLISLPLSYEILETSFQAEPRTT